MRLFWKTLVALLLFITSPICMILSMIESIREKKIEIFANLSITIIDKAFQALSFLWILPIKGDIDWIQYAFFYICIIFCICIVFGIMYIVDILSKKLRSYIYNKENNKLQIEKKPNIMIEAFKAIKSKVCPIIEYTND